MRVFLDAYLNNNLGDDLMIDMIVNRYPQHEFYVSNYNELVNIACSNNNLIVIKSITPTKEQFFLRAINKIFSYLNIPKLQVKKHFNSNFYDVNLRLGGSIFMQVTSKSWINKIRDARYIIKYCKKNMIIGCNFGPYFSDDFLYEHKKLFKKYDVVTFRENNSYEKFSDLDNVKVFPDIIFNLEMQEHIKTEKIIGISVISAKNKGIRDYRDKYIDGIVRMIKILAKDNKIVLMSFCSNEGDLEMCEHIKKQIGDNDLNVCIHEHTSVKQTLKTISEMSAMICTRFHASVISICADIPFVPIIYSNKTNNMLDDLNYKGYRWNIKDGEDINIHCACEQIKCSIDINKDRVKCAKGHLELLDTVLG